jgi:hypothetical protein
MLSIVYWLWSDEKRKILDPMNGPPSPRRYTAAHVNAQLSMLKLWAGAHPYEVVCVTTEDHAKDLDSSIRVVPMPVEDIDAPTKTFRWAIPCTRKLWSFSDEAAVLGKRILCLDIDTVIVGPMDEIFRRREPLVVIGGYGGIYGGAYMLDTGKWNDIWTSFLAWPDKTDITDQSWLTQYFGPGIACDRLPHFGKEVDILGAHDKPVPGNSVLTINMYYKPCDPQAEPYFPWMKDVHPMAFGKV